MKTILYATDYSENSQLALKYAYNMSIKIDAKLMVIHVFDYPTLLDNLNLKAEPAFPNLESDAFEKHKSELQAFCKHVLKSDAATLNIEIEAIENKSVVSGIIEKANAIDAFMIVTGIKGISKLRERIMGSTAKQLIEKAPCPVLTIPSDSVNKDIETIIYATDFEDKDLGAIHKLAEIAKPFNAKIKIVHISTLDETVGKNQMKDLEDTFHKHIDYPKLELDILYSDDAMNALKTYYRKTNADLIAMLERKRSGKISKVFHCDLVKQIESYGKIPLLSFNANNYEIFHL